MASDYWPIRPTAVASLHLDEKNPRLGRETHLASCKASPRSARPFGRPAEWAGRFQPASKSNLMLRKDAYGSGINHPLKNSTTDNQDNYVVYLCLRIEDRLSGSFALTKRMSPFFFERR